jgi:hypothetical protein
MNDVSRSREDVNEVFSPSRTFQRRKEKKTRGGRNYFLKLLEIHFTLSLHYYCLLSCKIFRGGGRKKRIFVERRGMTFPE